jgi:type IV pilus assembly protein PilA
MRNNKQKGFSLIELLIVVAIILIIAAIAIPNLLRSKMAANEASAVASLRTLNTTEILYSTNCNGLSTTLKELGPAAVAGTPVCATGEDLVDSVLSGTLGGTATTAVKNGYTLTYAPGTGTPPATYTITATPAAGAGIRNFWTDQTGVIHVEATAGAMAATDPPL